MEELQVLWVEDKTELHEPYSTEAYYYKIKLHPFTCWEKAKHDLIANYDDYSAIILDAKCKIREEDPDDALDFLPIVIKELSNYAIEKRRTIPWFILSAGGAEVGRLNWVKKHRMDWDDWEKDFYSKNIDRETLYARIPKIAVHSEATQIKTILYKDVFDALSSMKGIDENSSKNILVKVLSALHFRSDGFDPIVHYNQLRQLVEHLFRACNEIGLVPDQCIPKGEVNLTQSSLYLAGKDAGIVGVRYGGDDGRIVPEHIEKEIRSVLDLGNVNSHTIELDENDKQKLKEFFRTANSKYIVFSLALQLCDVVVWLKDYISNHNNKEENLSKCQLLPKDNLGDVGIELEHARKKYEGNKYMPSRDKDGDWYCGECSVILKDTHKGIIAIEQVVENNNPRTKRKYKFFAKYKHE